jgi:environmental stress-induced protein Ves
MRARVLRPADYRRMRWQNGGGWTTELAAFPTGGDVFDWRVSIAEIESDGAFSAFPGCDRHIALLEGVGMHLRFDQAPEAELRERLRFVAFAGEWQAHGRLIAGPVRDFNVIVRRPAYRAEILRRPLVGPMLFVPETATWFAYLAAGSAQCRIGAEQQTLATGDSLLLEPDTATDNIVLRGSGELVLVRFVPVVQENIE